MQITYTTGTVRQQQSITLLRNEFDYANFLGLGSNRFHLGRRFVFSIYTVSSSPTARMNKLFHTIFEQILQVRRQIWDNISQQHLPPFLTSQLQVSLLESQA